MEFASEMVVKATLNKLKTTEVPTRLFPDGRSRRPHLRPWRDGWRHLRLLLLFSPRWLFLYPGLFLLSSGLLLMSLLMMGSLNVGHIHLDIHTMLFSALFMIVGLQAACFAVFAEYITAQHLKKQVQHNYLLAALKYFTLERGLIIGLLLAVCGGVGACYGFWYWQHQAFGALNPVQMMRLLIPAITILVLGVQLIFDSFFMSLLDLHIGKEHL